MKEELHIREGEVWICKKTVRMIDSGEIVYVRGKAYKSECLDCLTDEGGEVHHFWTDDPGSDTYLSFPQYFRRVPKNKRSKWKK